MEGTKWPSSASLPASSGCQHNRARVCGLIERSTRGDGERHQGGGDDLGAGDGGRDDLVVVELLAAASCRRAASVEVPPWRVRSGRSGTARRSANTDDGRRGGRRWTTATVVGGAVAEAPGIGGTGGVRGKRAYEIWGCRTEIRKGIGAGRFPSIYFIRLVKN